MGDFHPATEEYLETIWELEESGISPIRARIVERLGVSAPSVSETVARLEREGYLTLDSGKVMQLTETGRSYARSMVRRHRLAERLLVDVLHVPWHQVHEEACRLEHAISESLEQHLVALLGDPGCCPHGNPIPGSVNDPGPLPLEKLSSVAAGASVIITRIDEVLENKPEGLLLLEKNALLPGAEVTVRATDGAMVTVSAGDTRVELPGWVTTCVLVLPAA
ncbi:MAG: DtxR family transcriptional regulator, Mn-dependent transcriptional regulator [Frankiaceae bacterium]|nr:DtxR family transcriptional regulator, Mn-dependent transcriptional regulator [Frankiaceae bacterium]